MEDYTQEGMAHALGWPKAIKKKSWRSGKVCKWGEAATAQDYLYSSLSLGLLEARRSDFFLHVCSFDLIWLSLCAPPNLSTPPGLVEVWGL